MTEKVIEFLDPCPGKKFVDGTIGEGGYSVEIAKRIKPGGLLMGIDLDKDILNIAVKRIEQTGVKFKYFCDSFSNVSKILSDINIHEVDGILLDLGFSRWHILKAGKGFSFSKDEVLDMRYNVNKGIPAYKWLNNASEDEINKVIKNLGNEKESKRISKEIIKYRKAKKIKTSIELSEIVQKAKKRKKKRIHPATKTFQAIRIFINKEIEELKKGLYNSINSLKKKGKLLVLTYHSIEDRAVKEFFLQYSGTCICPSGLPECRCGAESRRPRIEISPVSGTTPEEKEISMNPSARSAHIRACTVIVKG